MSGVFEAGKKYTAIWMSKHTDRITKHNINQKWVGKKINDYIEYHTSCNGEVNEIVPTHLYILENPCSNDPSIYKISFETKHIFEYLVL